MGSIIGETSVLSTWGALRYAVEQGVSPVTAAHNREYPVYATKFFKTTEGNGFLRPYLLGGGPPNMMLEPVPGTFDYIFKATGFPEPYPAQFVGEDVTVTGPDTFTITADAFVGPSYQPVVTIGYMPILSIGLLDPVT